MKESKKWMKIMKTLMHNILFKFNFEKTGTKQILAVLKNGISYLYSLLISNKEEASMPSINFIKILFEAFESKLSCQTFKETLRTNEIVYLLKKSYENNIKIISEKEQLKKKSKNLIKLRILTNQVLQINYENQTIFPDNTKFKEFNFFGLLLKVSKEFLTPSYNLILHIHGGGFFSQSSISHLDYLSFWARSTDTVIISIDYKVCIDNKYPILLDDCITAYESIVTQSAKFFSKI